MGADCSLLFITAQDGQEKLEKAIENARKEAEQRLEEENEVFSG